MGSRSFPPNCRWIGSLANDRRRQIGLYEPGANCVHPDIFMPVIDSHALRQQDDCAFGRRIGCAVASADNPERRRHVYDRTATAFSHVR
jgi:hypothetical protein